MAKWSGVCWYSFDLIFGFAPYFNNSLTIEIFCLFTAICKGLKSSSLVILGSAPFFSNNFICSIFSISTAWYKGVSPIVHFIFGSAPLLSKYIVDETSPDIMERYNGVQPHSSKVFIFDKSLQNIWKGAWFIGGTDVSVGIFCVLLGVEKLLTVSDDCIFYFFYLNIYINSKFMNEKK